VAASVCLVGVYAQGYWTSGEQEPLHDGDYPVYQSVYQLVPVSSSEALSGERNLAVSPYIMGSEYWVDRSRSGSGRGGKGKKKKGKKKKGKKKKKGGWGPVSVATHGVRVGWKGWIPPVHAKGW